MYNIADINSFITLKRLCKEKDLKNTITEEEFWLSMKSDIKFMIIKDENFCKVPVGLINDCIDEVTQDSLLAAFKGQNGFINNPSSKLAGARTNWLKSIVHKKLCDYLSHNQQIFNPTLSVEQDTTRKIPLDEVIEDTNIPTINESDVYFFARYYVFFTVFKYRIKSKIMYFNKELTSEREKAGKNGGISGKHNCLTEINGKPLFELGENVATDLKECVAFEIPENYLIEIEEAIIRDLSEYKKGHYIGDEIFDMKYSHAASENSRINHAFLLFEDRVNTFANELYNEIEDTKSLMCR